MRNCLMNRLSYYRFGEVRLSYQQPAGYDVNRLFFGFAAAAHGRRHGHGKGSGKHCRYDSFDFHMLILL